MSEHQHYEFLAVDRPLTAAQVAAVRQFSTRATITATHFVNTYQWGSFKGDADQFLKLYFDAHVYTANWGTHRFAFRLPRDLVDRPAVEAFAHDLSLNVKPMGDRLLVDIELNDEPGDHEDERGYQYDADDQNDGDGSGWMASMVGARAEVLGGDHRPLFLGWLAGVQRAGPTPAEADGGMPEHDDDDEPVPPAPAGLANLTAAQQSMVDFLRIEPLLLAAAAADSPPPARGADLAVAIASTPTAQKDRWLADLLGGDDPLAVASSSRCRRPPSPIARSGNCDRRGPTSVPATAASGPTPRPPPSGSVTPPPPSRPRNGCPTWPAGSTPPGGRSTR